MEPIDQLHEWTTLCMKEGFTKMSSGLEDQICQCGYKRSFHIIRRNSWGLNLLCPYSLFPGINGFKYGSKYRTLGGVFTYSVGFNND